MTDTEKLRTQQQNRSMHKLFNDISLHCMSTGIDIKTVTEKLEHYHVEVTPQFVKETWRTVQRAAVGKESTTELTTAELKIVQEEFGKLWSEITGEVFDWPSISSLMDAQLDERKYQ